MLLAFPVFGGVSRARDPRPKRKTVRLPSQPGGATVHYLHGDKGIGTWLPTGPLLAAGRAPPVRVLDRAVKARCRGGQAFCNSLMSDVNLMRIRAVIALLLLLAAGLPGCATTRDPGLRVLDAVVIGREFEPAGRIVRDPRAFMSLREEAGSWYLMFEARDGEAMVHYRLSVTQQQYQRFEEGSYVQITMVGYELREVRRRI